MDSPKNIDEKVAQTVSDEQLEEGTSLLSDSLRKFKKNKMAVISCFIITILFVASLAAKYITPYSFDEGALEEQNFPPTWYKVMISTDHKSKLLEWAANDTSTFDDGFDSGTDAWQGELDLDAGIENTIEQPLGIGFFNRSINHLDAESVKTYLEMSTWQHILGTDELGQDILSRMIFGIRLSLFLALTVTFVSLIVGVSYGSISGYFGGMVDQLMMRVVDFLFGIPFIFLIILLMVLFGREVFLIFVGLGLVYWIVLARIVRGQILSIKEKEFVMAARSNGVGQFTIIFKHLVPNVLGPVIIFATLLVPQIMLLEAFLSFIGLGVTPPDVSLGIMISDGASVISNYSWPIIFPGIIFSMMIFCMNFIGDGLRDALDPKFK